MSVSKYRIVVAQILLWVAVINGAIWLGGTVFMMTVFNPLWTSTPPESVRAYWVHAGFYDTIFNFFGPAWQVVRVLPVVGVLIASWRLSARPWLVMHAAAWLVALIMTRAYIYPINEVLFTPAIDSLSSESARELTDRWVLADRIRFAVMTAGFIALLRAFSMPLVTTSRRS